MSAAASTAVNHHAQRSSVIEYSVKLAEILQKEKQTTDVEQNGLSGLQAKLTECLSLFDQVASNLGPYETIVRKIVRELQYGIYSNEKTIFPDEKPLSGDNDCRFTNSQQSIPYAVLYYNTKNEAEHILQQKKVAMALHEETNKLNEQMSKDTVEFRQLLRDKDKVIADYVLQRSELQESFENVSEEKRNQHREMKNSSLSLHRELKAMDGLMHSYRNQIKELHAARDASQNLRKSFEALQRKNGSSTSRNCQKRTTSGAARSRVNTLLLHAAEKKNPTTRRATLSSTLQLSGPSPEEMLQIHVGELEQASLIESQLLLIRNTRLNEFEKSIESCSSTARNNLEFVFTSEFSMIEKELLEIETYIQKQLVESIPELKMLFVAQESAIDNELLSYDRSWADIFQSSLAVYLASKPQEEHHHSNEAQLETIASAQLCSNTHISSSLLWKDYRDRGCRIQKNCRVFSLPVLLETLDQFWLSIMTQEQMIDREIQESGNSRNVETLVRTLPDLLYDFLSEKYGDEEGAMMNVMYSILTSVEFFFASENQVELFRAAYCNEVEQCAWRYFYRAKTFVSSSIRSLTTIENVVSSLYPSRRDTPALERLVATLVSRYKEKLSAETFTAWLAEVILNRTEVRVTDVENRLTKKAGKKAEDLGLAPFIDVVLDSVKVPRGLIARYFRYASTEGAEEVSISRLSFILAYLEMKDIMSSTTTTTTTK